MLADLVHKEQLRYGIRTEACEGFFEDYQVSDNFRNKIFATICIGNLTHEEEYLGVKFQSWFCLCKKFFQIILNIFGLHTIGANWVWREL